jgi:hypothetical protein
MSIFEDTLQTQKRRDADGYAANMKEWQRKKREQMIRKKEKTCLHICQSYCERHVEEKLAEHLQTRRDDCSVSHTKQVLTNKI